MGTLPPLGAEDALALWERGERLRPMDRTEMLLGRAFPGAAQETLAELTVGERQKHLLRLLSTTFGEVMPVVAECEACGETLELALEIGGLLHGGGELPGAVETELEVEGYALRVRPLRAADLRVAAECEDRGAARRRLGERAVLSASYGGEPVAAWELPASVVARVGEALATLDPTAELLLELTCPSCGTTVTPEVDPAGLLWAELSALAVRLLREVHTLATAYGWSEGEVLRMTPRRRAAYLAHVEA